MDLELKDRRALVGGGSRGIGRAVAERLVIEGARVVIVSRSAPSLPLSGAEHVAADLATADGCAAAWTAAEKSLGGVDLLLINAGGPPTGPTLFFGDAAWEEAFQRNFLSAVRLCRLAVPDMIERGFGRIVAITSISALEPIDGLVLSNAMRPAVHGFLKTLAREVAPHGVTVNAIAPGYTATERMKEVVPAERLPALIAGLPMKRMVEPAETAQLAAFLMSAGAASITGSLLACDGGMLRRL